MSADHGNDEGSGSAFCLANRESVVTNEAEAAKVFTIAADGASLQRKTGGTSNWWQSRETRWHRNSAND
jgi:hypothetical protein